MTTSFATASVPVVGLRCDATTSVGVGHLVRCLAIADELASRGLSAVVLGDVEVPWVRAAVEARGIRVLASYAAPGALADQAVGLGLTAVVLDGYALATSSGGALRARGIRVLAVHDGPFGAGQDADVHLDQNLGATPLTGLPAGSVSLSGLGYALLRDEVLRHRPDGVRVADAGCPRVLAVFGGTDPHGAGPVLVRLLLDTGLPADVVAVAATPDHAARLGALSVGPGQSLSVLEPVPDLAGLAAGCDVVVTASGSSVWEFLCLGVPAAVVSVAPNQDLGYRAVVGAGLAAPAGSLDTLRSDPAARAATRGVLADLLTSPTRRAAMAEQGMRLVDGQGRSRVVDRLLADDGADDGPRPRRV